DVWPPARPCAQARLVTEREDVQPNAAWSGITIVSEIPQPVDGNPNHLHVTLSRNAEHPLTFGGDGDVQNPDANLTFFTAYMAWWSADPTTCSPPGGPGNGPPPVPSGCGRGCSLAARSETEGWALGAACFLLLAAARRRRFASWVFATFRVV